MAEKPNGEYTIKIDDEKYTLFYDMNALAELEEVTGKGIGEFQKMFQREEDIRISNFRALFWAGLLHENEDLTIKEAGKILSKMARHDFSGAVEKIGLAFAAAFGTSEGEAKKRIELEKKKRLNGTGK